MERFDSSRSNIELTDSRNSSEPPLQTRADKVVPDSFADWLAQPAQTIEDPGAAQEQEVFMELIAESQAQSMKQPPPTQNRSAC